jgi:hypothetical protein
MVNILVISEIVDYIKTPPAHFSLSKGYYFSIGLSKIEDIQVYYYTTGQSEIINSINFINEIDITDEFLKRLNYLILIRETNLLDIMKLSFIKNIREYKNIKTYIKCDSIAWINNKVYKKAYENRHKFLNFILGFFDGICCQTEMLKEEGITTLKKIHKINNINNLKKKIIISRMGVPNIIPQINMNIENPYDINHSYCNKNNVCYDKALEPCIINENYNKKKCILIYGGRIKTENGNILYFMKDIMKKLGDDYELHIFPGRFSIPNMEQSIFSPKNKNHLLIMRNTVFNDSTNVIIHFPYDENNKLKYFKYADIALDFSPVRPRNIKSPAGNAKMLDYCYYGLKIVGETNIGNSELGIEAKNSILIDNIGTVDEYVEAIKKIETMDIDRNYAINCIINNHNWDIIAKEFYDDITKS